MIVLGLLSACTSANARPAPGGHSPGDWCHCPDLPVGAPDVLLVVGHSWVAGSDGDDLQYSGRTLPPSVVWRQSGVVRTAWTSTPSVLPYLADHMPRPSVIISRGVGSSDVDDWTTTHWPAAVADVTAQGAGAPDMIILWLGGNDASSPADVANFATKYPALVDTIEAAYPSASLVLIQDARIDLNPGGIGPYISDIRDIIAGEAGPGRTIVDAAAETYTIQISGHPLGGVGEGYDDIAHLIVSTW